MPKFNDTIRQAVMRACEAAGNECALAAAVGCSQTQISRYRSGRCAYIRPESWDKLYPHIAPYLPEDFQPDTEPPKRKKPNESIFKAVDAAARHHPRGGFGLATDAGFTPAQICRYRHGKVSWFSSKTLARLLPHIKPYLAGTTAETLCHDSTGDGSMSEDDFQLNTLHLLDALIVTLNFRPKIECPPELQGRLKQLQIAIGRHFCAAGERGVDDCAWNCRYAGTEKCNSKCRYSSIGDSGVPGSEAAGAADSTGEEAQP